MEERRFESFYPPLTMQKEIGKALNILNAGNFVQVVGLPGVGKSTMLRLLAYNPGVRKFHLKEKEGICHFVYMNFSEVKNRSLLEVTKFMLLTLAASLSERGKVEEAEFVQAQIAWSVPLNDEMVYFQALRTSVEHLCNTRQIHLVFLIDRIGTYFPNISEQFFTNLRLLRNSAKYTFSVVFSLSRPLDMTLGTEMVQEIADLTLGNTVFVNVYQEVGLEFRIKYIEEVVGKKLGSKTRERLIALTGGHGKLAKIGCEALLAEGDISDIEVFLLGRRQMQNALSDLWNYFTVEEQEDIAVLPDDCENNFLVSLGIVRDGSVTIPIFNTYIASQRDIFQKLSYDVEKKIILRGGRDISEMFSASEFRLLSFLLMRSGEVVSRDELIEHIWGELATQEGVTPQAFDQLMYRVRKKIENDPANPIIITTIKGRGYKISN